jgi:N-acetylmuramoyl-L-alanine amidase CwlA
MELREDFIAKNTPPRPCIALKDPSSITIHWVGPYPGQTPYDVINYWVGEGLEASAHFVIKDGLTVCAIPTTEVAWHCGPKGNYTSIGIEVVPMNRSGEFSDASIASLYELIKAWPNLELLRHYDWTQKDCPRFYTPEVVGGNDAWEDLKLRLRS